MFLNKSAASLRYTSLISRLSLKKWRLVSQFYAQFTHVRLALDTTNSNGNSQKTIHNYCGGAHGGKRRITAIAASLIYRWFEQRCLEWNAEELQRELLEGFEDVDVYKEGKSNVTGSKAKKKKKKAKSISPKNIESLALPPALSSPTSVATQSGPSVFSEPEVDSGKHIFPSTSLESTFSSTTMENPDADNGHKENRGTVEEGEEILGGSDVQNDEQANPITHSDAGAAVHTGSQPKSDSKSTQEFAHCSGAEQDLETINDGVEDPPAVANTSVAEEEDVADDANKISLELESPAASKYQLDIRKARIYLEDRMKSLVKKGTFDDSLPGGMEAKIVCL